MCRCISLWHYFISRYDGVLLKLEVTIASTTLYGRIGVSQSVDTLTTPSMAQIKKHVLSKLCTRRLCRTERSLYHHDVFCFPRKNASLSYIICIALTIFFFFLLLLVLYNKNMPHFTFAFILSCLIVVHSRRKKSLTWDGAAAAFLLGLVTFSSSLYVFTVVLLAFFLSSSKLTKFKANRKRILEAEYELSSERNYVQVLCNGLAGGIAVTLFQMYCETQNYTCFNQARWSTILLWAYIG